MSSLKIEIVKRIFVDLGINLDRDRLEHEFVVNDRSICSSKITVEELGKAVQKDLWAADLEVASAVMKVMICDLSDQDFREFALVFRLDALPVYAIRLSSDPDDDGTFMYHVDLHANTSGWVSTPTYLQATVLAGIEQLSSFSLNWKPSKSSDELRLKLISFLETGD